MLLAPVLKPRRALWACVVLSTIAAACSSSTDSSFRDEPPSSGAKTDPSAVLAMIDDRPVTMAEIQHEVGERLASMEFQYRSQRHQLIDGALKKLVRDRLFEQEAKKRGTTVQAMLSAETHNVRVSPEEASRWYEQNKARLGGRPLEQVLPQIQQFLAQQKRGRAVEKLAKRLEEKNKVVYRLEPLRADIDITDSPAKGSDDAPITIVEFSDFECGYCGRLFQTLKNVEQNYGERIRVVFKQFPLDIHPNARKAAEAALCAEDQGKFWDMHDLLFAEQSQLAIDALKQKASRLGLDRSAFEACLDSGRHADKVQRDLRDGAAVGVTGTPALFVNGIPVSGGAVPYEVISDAIDDELARVGAR